MYKTYLIFFLLVSVSMQAFAGSIPSEEGVSAHNAVRAKANQGQYAGQPIPNPQLKELSWDNNLAESAQQYANQCVWQHSTNRVNTGENLYVQASSSAGTQTSISQAVDSWAGEYQFYDFGSTTCQAGEMCGHYTQIVWRDSLQVGCAVASCNPIVSPDGTPLFPSEFPFSNFIVCQYGPAGNLTGLQPYDTNGADSSLFASYEITTEILQVPYLLLRNPDNIVTPYTATLSLINNNPYTFSVDSVAQVDYLGLRHSDSYDVNTAQLFLLDLQVLENGSSLLSSAVVLEYKTASGGFELKTIK